MGTFSILPDHLSAVETWIIRVFLGLAVICVGPWLVLMVYDILLYVWRSAIYTLPYFGGRARGRRRPRAPSFAERPSGNKRHLNMYGRSPKHGDGGRISEAAASSDTPSPPTDTRSRKSSRAT